MTTMRHEIEIARPAEQLMAYACAPTRWPDWHPSSLRVQGASGPLPAGSLFEEDIRAGGREDHIRWQVIEYLPARRWQARASGSRGLELLLTYECQDSDGAARFARTLEYRFDGLALHLANLLFLRRRIERESVQSLKILREVAEGLILRVTAGSG
jgi:hypothetical protein